MLEQYAAFLMAQARDDSVPLHLIRWRKIEVTHLRIIVCTGLLARAPRRGNGEAGRRITTMNGPAVGRFKAEIS